MFETCKNTFDQIYLQNTWGDGDGSGGGSEPLFTVNMRHSLVKWMLDHDIHSLLDCSCGAAKWTAELISEAIIAIPDFKFMGIDVSTLAIDRAKINLAKFDVELIQGDLSIDALPKGFDLIICRDTFQHLSLDRIRACLANLASSEARFIMIGGYIQGTNLINPVDGDSFPFNPQAPPFNLRANEIIDECHPNDGNLSKSLFVFTCEAIR